MAETTSSSAGHRFRADLARSPWSGEGHRKVWARLRAMDGIRVSRKRVLRLMREHALLPPHRARPRPEAPHERRIITEAPDAMWATDATQITTVEDGKVRLFGVAEHWNAELLGWAWSRRRAMAGTNWLRQAGGMTPEPTTYPRYRFPAEVIHRAVWLYHVFSLSLALHVP